MQIAYTMTSGRGDADMVLDRLARRLTEAGLRVCGTVQINTARADGHPCDMDVLVLPDGPVIRISQSLGHLAKGCRLDPSALEEAVALVEGRLDERPDVLLINKFGKHEAEGRGFRDVIAQALALSIPVIAGVNALNLKAFLTFVENEATFIEADVEKLVEWLRDNDGGSQGRFAMFSASVASRTEPA